MTASSSTPPPAPPARKPNVRILLGFLAVYLLLLVLFHEVLFPFLMAIFLAYLIEPIVRYVKQRKLFGIDWGRGPIVVVLYGLLVGTLAFAGWKAVVKLATTVRSTATDVSDALREEGGRAVFTLERPDEGPHHTLVIPVGTVLASGPAGRTSTWKTLHEARIEPDAKRVEVLLEQGEIPKGAPRLKADDELKLVDPSTLKLVGADEGAMPAVTVAAGNNPPGSELAFERHIIGPVVKNLATRGIEIEPTSVREFVAVKAQALSEDLPDRVTKGALGIAGKLVLSVYQFFLILMITAFLVMDRKAIGTFFASLPPDPYKAGYGKLMRYVDDGLAGVIRGQLMICLVNGILTWLGLLLLGVKGATWLGMLAAVLSLIPIFGTILSSIPIVVIGTTDSIETGVLALAWIVLIHVIEANVLNPLIMGSHARMHPVIIIFALLAGEHYFGVWGALLAVPTASIVQSCFRFYLHEVEGLPEPPHDDSHGQAFKKLIGWVKKKLGKGDAPAAAS
ncbi:MAG: AI-2E family transporter [Planctomycetota bacterium]